MAVPLVVSGDGMLGVVTTLCLGFSRSDCGRMSRTHPSEGIPNPQPSSLRVNICGLHSPATKTPRPRKPRTSLRKKTCLPREGIWVSIPGHPGKPRCCWESQWFQIDSNQSDRTKGPWFLKKVTWIYWAWYTEPFTTCHEHAPDEHIFALSLHGRIVGTSGMERASIQRGLKGIEIDGERRQVNFGIQQTLAFQSSD